MSAIQTLGIFEMYKMYAKEGYLEFSVEEFTSVEDSGWEDDRRVTVKLPDTLEECLLVSC